MIILGMRRYEENWANKFSEGSRPWRVYSRVGYELANVIQGAIIKRVIILIKGGRLLNILILCKINARFQQRPREKLAKLSLFEPNLSWYQSSRQLSNEKKTITKMKKIMKITKWRRPRSQSWRRWWRIPGRQETVFPCAARPEPLSSPLLLPLQSSLLLSSQLSMGQAGAGRRGTVSPCAAGPEQHGTLTHGSRGGAAV